MEEHVSMQVGKDTPRPYIGVTGLKTVEEVQQLSDICFRAGLFGSAYNHQTWYGIPHVPMFGFLCSSKRLVHPSEGGTQSPPLQDLMTLTRMTPTGAIPMVHYHSPDKDRLASDVKQIFDGPFQIYRSCKALQVNMDWPPPAEIESIRKAFPEMQVVLQLPRRATEGMQPVDIAKRVKEYEDLAQYALIDPSGGKGKEFDVGDCRSVLEALLLGTAGFVFGTAGGLDGKNVRERVLPIANTVDSAYFCIDAQGKLRTANKESLDMTLAKEYIFNARAAFEEADHAFYAIGH
ncbi:hypothetical protein HY642_04880 [Candidatus Woesearchaeota archaeon]|nr:hypothetical protein [Candidatus Woesearchaeota archaeon]